MSNTRPKRKAEDPIQAPDAKRVALTSSASSSPSALSIISRVHSVIITPDPDPDPDWPVLPPHFSPRSFRTYLLPFLGEDILQTFSDLDMAEIYYELRLDEICGEDGNMYVE